MKVSILLMKSLRLKEIIDFLDELKPDIVVKGLEHSELLDPLEMNLLNSYGAKFISIRASKKSNVRTA